MSALVSLGLLKANTGLSVDVANVIGFAGADGAAGVFAVNANTGIGSAGGLPVRESVYATQRY